MAEGDRFGRPPKSSEHLRVHLVDDPKELDPARARTAVEKALARQLFAPLVEPGAGPGVGDMPALAVHRVEGDTLVLELRRDARFSDGTLVRASDVLWSWRRALRPSTHAVDTEPFSTMQNGTALAQRSLLRVASNPPALARAPFVVFRAGPADDVSAATLAPGTPVRVVDTHLRVPCCGEPVPLTRGPDDDEAVGALLAGEVGVVLATREDANRVSLQIRAPSGAAGWARASLLDTHVPVVGLVHVVDRGDGRLALFSGPDADAPVRATLVDDDVLEIIERDFEWARAIDLKSGRTGAIPTSALDETIGERRWFQVETLDEPTRRGWLPDRALAFDPSLLGAEAVDDRTIVVRLAAPPEVAVRALAEPVMRPVSPRAIEEHGVRWTEPAHILTTGPFQLHDRKPTSIELARAPSSAELKRARLSRVTFVIVANKTTALHLYRAGFLDVVLDGALPTELAPTLRRAKDFRDGPLGGGLIADEVKGFDVNRIELRDVRIDP